MGDNHDLQDPQEAEAEVEEALSLSDFPLNAEDPDSPVPRSSSDPAQFFEFFSDFSSEMCPAEEIIFGGKLVPFKDHSPSPPTRAPSTKQHHSKPMLRRRSESLSELLTPRSNSANTQIMRTSRSLDFQKLYRSSSRAKSSPSPEINRNSSGKSVEKFDISVPKTTRSRWHLLMFGMVKFPPEMELRDIKSRQFRRHPATFFPPVDAVGKNPVNRSGAKGPWAILRALSCKDDASVAVTASFRCIPQS